MNYSDTDMENELTYTRFDYMAGKYPKKAPSSTWGSISPIPGCTT